VLRRTQQIIGTMLVIFSLLYLCFMFLAASGLGGLYLSRGEDLTDHISSLGIVGPFISGLLMLMGGLSLRDGKKRAILFLRPFNSIANELTMRSILGRIGSRFTAVALDDGTIPCPRSSITDKSAAMFLLVPAGLLLLLFFHLCAAARYTLHFAAARYTRRVGGHALAGEFPFDFGNGFRTHDAWTSISINISTFQQTCR
jgi:hypothetical protein